MPSLTAIRPTVVTGDDTFTLRVVPQLGYVEEDPGVEAIVSPTPDATRDELVLQYQPLVKYVANRLNHMLPTGVDREDLIGYGTLGLIDAIDRFDVSRGIKLSTFAATRIRGAILDALRALDPLPRSVRQHARRASQAVEELTGAFGRNPTTAEVAGRLGVPVARYRDIRASVAWRTVSLDAVVNEQDHDGATRNIAEHISTGEAEMCEPMESQDLLEALAAETGRLGERERTLLALRFTEGLTGRGIAERMHLSESRVFQLLRSTTEQLRERLAPVVMGEERKERKDVPARKKSFAVIYGGRDDRDLAHAA